MRARNIKPGFFKCCELSEVDFASRLLFIGLWCFADREGRFEWKPKKIKAEIFPYDNVNVDKLLCNLMSLHFITRNDSVGYVENFKKHQSPHPHEAKSTLPEKNEQNQCHDVSVTSREMSLTCRADVLIDDVMIPDSLIPDITRSEPLSDHSMILNDGSKYRPTVKIVDEWERLFPAVDVAQQLRSMEAWCIANPRKRKTKGGIAKFITSWLGKEQDKGGGRASPPQRTFDQMRVENTRRVIDEWEPGR